MLTPDDESKAVTSVAERLAQSFPQVTADEVQFVVHRSHEQFAGNPIRDFVPVLVERMAREDLRAKLTG